jgi:hypothetical protein
MAKSHPAPFREADAPQLPIWARNTIASFTLAVCLISLNTILNVQHGVQVATAVGQSVAALDLAQVLAAGDEPAPAAAESPNLARYRAVGEYLARRYRVSSDMTTSVVAKAHSVGGELKIDPLLIWR